jgi:hypothetical protein
MLSLPRSEVGVHCWDGADGINWTSIYLGVPIGGMPTDTLHEWIDYLDRVAPGLVTVGTTALWHPIEIEPS